MKIILTVIFAAALSAALPARAASPDITCSLKFTSKQWSVLYEHAEGTGTITCDNGKKMEVDIAAKGLGLSAGKWKIDDGIGKFTHVKNIYDLLGSYAALSANVGVAKAGTVQALTNGKVSLVLAGIGDGFDAGVTISKFKIERSAIDGST